MQTRQEITDPFESVEYHQFVAQMANHCHCAASHKPCDGVLAGGPCDEVGGDEIFDFDEQDFNESEAEYLCVGCGKREAILNRLCAMCTELHPARL